jgi:hypothetical protein
VYDSQKRYPASYSHNQGSTNWFQADHSGFLRTDKVRNGYCARFDRHTRKRYTDEAGTERKAEAEKVRAAVIYQCFLLQALIDSRSADYSVRSAGSRLIDAEGVRYVASQVVFERSFLCLLQAGKITDTICIRCCCACFFRSQAGKSAVERRDA